MIINHNKSMYHQVAVGQNPATLLFTPKITDECSSPKNMANLYVLVSLTYHEATRFVGYSIMFVGVPKKSLRLSASSQISP